MGRLWLLFVVITFVYVAIGTPDRAEANQPISQVNSQAGIVNQAQASNTGKPDKPCRESSKKSRRKSQRVETKKPERNRFEENKGKKSGGSKKRKKTGKKTNASKMSLKETVTKGTGKKRTKLRKTERIDDIPVLINVITKAGIQNAIDKHIPPQKNQRDLSWGRTATIWLAYILTTGDHRKVAVQEYVSGMADTLTALIENPVSEKDLSDDRLSVLAGYLSEEKYWSKIEQTVSENSVDIFELPKEIIRVDATTVSGDREVVEGELFQFGHSKDDPDKPQIKIMTGSLDPLGMPLASDVVSGERADDGLYSPIVERISTMLKKEGLLYVGDCKLSSFGNRLQIKAKAKSSYLCPLPNTGKTPENMEEWIEEGNRKNERKELIKYIVTNEKGEHELKAKGYETERHLSGEFEGKKIKWTERVLIVKSPAHEKQQKKGLERRLSKAEEKLLKLTPQRGRGKRQITNEKDLKEKATSILKKHRVEGLLDYSYEKEVETSIKYVGRGRGSKNKEKRSEEKIRYQMTNVSRNDEKIKETIKGYGWKAYVTDVAKERLGFVEIVRTYRKQYRIERIFNRLKSRLNIAPLYVKRKDQIRGMTHLLMLAVRVHTLVEFVVRSSLGRTKQKIVGLFPENPNKATDSPTCERILKVFSGINLTVLEIGNSVERHITPLTSIQADVLRHLGFEPSIYNDLEEIT